MTYIFQRMFAIFGEGITLYYRLPEDAWPVMGLLYPYLYLTSITL
jgi:hypothetical protein